MFARNPFQNQGNVPTFKVKMVIPNHGNRNQNSNGRPMKKRMNSEVPSLDNSFNNGNKNTMKDVGFKKLPKPMHGIFHPQTNQAANQKKKKSSNGNSQNNIFDMQINNPFIVSDFQPLAMPLNPFLFQNDVDQDNSFFLFSQEKEEKKDKSRGSSNQRKKPQKAKKTQNNDHFLPKPNKVFAFGSTLVNQKPKPIQKVVAKGNQKKKKPVPPPKPPSPPPLTSTQKKEIKKKETITTLKEIIQAKDEEGPIKDALDELKLKLIVEDETYLKSKEEEENRRKEKDEEFKRMEGLKKLECPVCLDDTKQRFMLSKCGHCLCSDCWNTLFEGNDKAICPICKHKTKKSNLREVFV